MAGQKVVTIGGSGNLQEVASIQTGAGAADAGKLIAANADGYVDPTLLPNMPQKVYTASEAIAAGKFINLWNDAGTTKARLADNGSISTQADGMALTAAVNPGDPVTVGLDDLTITGLTGMTPAAIQFLGSAGGRTETPPTATGSILQQVGKADTSSVLQMQIDEPIIRA